MSEGVFGAGLDGPFRKPQPCPSTARYPRLGFSVVWLQGDVVTLRHLRCLSLTTARHTFFDPRADDILILLSELSLIHI